jgi:CHASE3 domain sensor protein
VLLSWLASHLFDVASRVDHTDQVLAQALNSERLVVDLETGLRGFQITGDKQVLETYIQSDPLASAELNKLDQLVSDNPAQMA